MGYFLFVDESGHDRREAPYMVLAGIIVEDRNIWGLIQTIRKAEEVFFGMRITQGELELKGKKLLKRKTYKHALQFPNYVPDERTRLARSCLEKGFSSRGSECNEVTKDELTALAQAKIAYVKYIFDHYCPVKKTLDARINQLAWATDGFPSQGSISEN